MRWSRTFPQESRIIDALIGYKINTRPEILALIETGKPLPSNTEIQNRFTGEWEPISDTALEAANRAGMFSSDPYFWHYSWRDIWPRLRIGA